MLVLTIRGRARRGVLREREERALRVIGSLVAFWCLERLAPIIGAMAAS